MRTENKKYTINIQTFDRLSFEEEEAWEALVIELKRNPTLLPFWLRAVVESWALDPTEIFIFLLYRNRELVGVIPYELKVLRTLGIPLNVLTIATRYVSYHAELISKIPMSELLDVFFAKVEGDWDKFMMENLCQNGPTIASVEEFAESRSWRVMNRPVDVAPYLTLVGTWDDLLAEKKRRTRYKIRRRNERLHSSNELKLEWITRGEHVSRFMAALVEVEKNSWKADDGVAVSAGNREGNYYARLLPRLAEKNALVANVLWYFDKPIAYSLCCRWSGWVGHLKTGFDKEFDGMSAGALVIDASLQDAFNSGASEFDFLGTAGQLVPDPHKLRWTNETRRHINIEVFSNNLVPRSIGLAKEIMRSLVQGPKI